MAGMFYSMKEAAEKLNVTEEKIKELVQAGRLREFRDGPNLLFKVDEVELLLSDVSLSSQIESESAAEAEPIEEPASVEAEPIEEPASEDLVAGTDISLELEADDTVAAEPPALEPPEEEETAVDAMKETGIEEAAQSEIFLASTGSESALSDLTSEELTSGDTALTSEGVNVLGETDSEYQVVEDTKGETQEISAEEPSLEQIEEDVNLDSFGSGSGLLDLSLQADDTSLGGILDDIYMSEGEEGQEAAPVDGSAMEMAVEAEHLIAEEAPEAQVPVITGAMPAYIEPEADTTTTFLVVFTLVISLVVAVYTAVVVLSTSVGSMLQGFFMYALGGCLLLAIALGGASIVTGGDKTKTKKPKAKKEKKVKPKKEKKKKEKPKKEKKKKEKKKK
jgi:excisionase family DNA binding protein